MKKISAFLISSAVFLSATYKPNELFLKVRAEDFSQNSTLSSENEKLKINTGKFFEDLRCEIKLNKDNKEKKIKEAREKYKKDHPFVSIFKSVSDENLSIEYDEQEKAEDEFCKKIEYFLTGVDHFKQQELLKSLVEEIKDCNGCFISSKKLCRMGRYITSKPIKANQFYDLLSSNAHVPSFNDVLKKWNKEIENQGYKPEMSAFCSTFEITFSRMLERLETLKNDDSKTQDILNFLDSHKNLPAISEEHPYNEIDGIVFSMLSYLPISSLTELGEDKKISLSEFYENYCVKCLRFEDSGVISTDPSESHTKNRFIDKDNQRGGMIFGLLQAAVRNNRYKDIQISDTLVKFNKESKEKNSEQFAAITFNLPEGTKVVTYRGTDGTLAGWKENIDLAWKEGEVPSQAHAGAYLNSIMEKYKDQKIAITGHSKGGHLAMYAAFAISTTYPNELDRIKTIYNFDGPGIREDIINKDKNRVALNKIKDKIIVFTPQNSVVGTLLNNNNFQDGIEYICVKSNAKFMKQHDLLTWNINVDGMQNNVVNRIARFEDGETLAQSRWLSCLIKDAMKKLKPSEIRDFSNALFKSCGDEDPNAIFLKTNTKTFLSNFWNHLNFSEKKSIIKVLNTLVGSVFAAKRHMPRKGCEEILTIKDIAKITKL